MSNSTGYLILAILPDVAWRVVVEATWKGALLLALVTIVVRCGRWHSAATRHLVWCAAVVSLLLLPILSAGLPGWNVLPAWMGTASFPANPPTDARPPASLGDDPRIADLSDAITYAGDPSIPAQRVEQHASLGTGESTLFENTAASERAGDTPSQNRASSPTPTGKNPPQPASAWLVAIWFLGAGLFVLRIALGHISLWQLTRRCTCITHGRLREVAEQLMASQQIGRQVRLVISDDRQIPMTWGLWRPNVLLPADAEQWDDARLRSALTHELAHVQRCDCLTQCLAQMTCALHWLNPLAWLAARRMDAEREQACDDVVLSSGVVAADYAEHLIGIAAGMNEYDLATYGAMAMARPSELESRVLMVLDESVNRQRARPGLRAGVFLACACCLAPIAVLHALDVPVHVPVHLPPTDPANDAGPTAPPVELAVADQPAGPAHSQHYAEFAAALDALGRVVDTPEFKRPDSPQVGAASRMLYRMQALPAAERYELLKKWTFPEPGRDAVRIFFGVIPDAPPPQVFLRESLPSLDDPTISTATLLVEAARDADKLTSLSNALQRLVNDDREGAELLSQLIDSAHERGAAFRPGLASLFDDDELERQLVSAQRSANFTLVLWFYRARALAAIERIRGASLQPSTDPGLKHWVPVDLAGAANCNQFSSTSWWVALDDRIGHVCSPCVDHLAFAYPLTGTFEISCEAFNDYWSEANIGFGGLMFEAWNQGSGRNQVYPVNAHEIVFGPKPAQVLGQFNPMTIRVQPGRIQVRGNDNLLFEDSSPSPTSPFLLLRTTWLSAFRKLRITGQPVIPREISLLKGRRLDGWMSSFYNESQPPDLTVRQQPQGAAVSRNDEPNAYDWSAAEGVIHGRRFADLNSPTRRSGFQHGESWLYYHRPLRNSERISYEFLYRPGEEGIEIHPTLDRLAFLLHPDGVKLHWLTTNRSEDKATGWIATDNLVEEPANRRGSNRLPLNMNDWNAASVSIVERRVRVELNGQLIYERPLEKNWGSRFGLYHDRTRTSSRVRNVVLSGDWPVWSPELAAKLLERKAPLAPADVEAIRTILTPRLTAGNPNE